MSSPEKDSLDDLPYDRNHPDFIEAYEHTGADDGITYHAPFAVAVFGIDKEFLGVGLVIGSINENPVIEIEDKDTKEAVCVMGFESWWTCPVPDEILEDTTNGSLRIASVAAYRRAQGDDWITSELESRTFLDESGIDPESI